MPGQFNVDTHQARTDLYGIDKGAAQVIDLAPTRRKGEINQAREDKKVADDQAKKEALITSISSLGKGDVRPNDVGYFAGKQKGVAELVKEKFRNSKGGLSIDDQLEIEMAINGIKQEALISKNWREQAEALQRAAILNPDKFNDAEEVKAINDGLYDVKNAGKWGDMPTLTEHFDYGAHVLKDLQPKARAWGENNRDNRGNETFTADQAKEMIAQDLQDEVKFKNVDKAFTRAKDKLGATNPLEYAYALYVPDLMVNKRGLLTEAGKYGRGNTENKDIRVTHTEKDDSDEYAVQDSKTNEEVILIKKNGKIVGGIKGGKLTASEKADRDKAISYNNGLIKEYHKSIADIKKKASEHGWTPGGVQAALPAKPQLQHVPNQEKGVEISAEEAQKIAYNKYGVDAEQIMNGGQPGVTVKKVDGKKGVAKQEDLRKKYNY